MNWTPSDIDIYLQQQSYIDTIVVPLLKVDFSSDTMKNSASSHDFLMHMMTYLETQFKGRLMVAPLFSYTSNTDVNNLAKQIETSLTQASFKHCFFFTSDPTWNSIETQGKVIWLPSIPLDHMDGSLKQTIIEDQLRQILPILTEKWAQQ